MLLLLTEELAFYKVCFFELLIQVAGRYEAGTAFVSKDNPRSLQAHIHKLGMEVLRNFEFNGKPYVLLGFTVEVQGDREP